jgi:hypothetical protein
MRITSILINTFPMPDSILHLRIKKEYAAELIDDLIKVEAVENIGEDNIVLTPQQQQALDHELVTIAANPTHLQKWNDVKSRFKKP